MADELKNLFENSDKAEFLDAVAEDLQQASRAIVILVIDEPDNKYKVISQTIGFKTVPDILGTMEIAKNDYLK